MHHFMVQSTKKMYRKYFELQSKLKYTLENVRNLEGWYKSTLRCKSSHSLHGQLLLLNNTNGLLLHHSAFCFVLKLLLQKCNLQLFSEDEICSSQLINTLALQALIYNILSLLTYVTAEQF